MDTVELKVKRMDIYGYLVDHMRRQIINLRLFRLCMSESIGVPGDILQDWIPSINIPSSVLWDLFQIVDMGYIPFRLTGEYVKMTTKENKNDWYLLFDEMFNRPPELFSNLDWTDWMRRGL